MINQPVRATGIYVHIPYCKQRCTYCDFYFVTNHGSTALYTERLVDEIRLRSQAHPREVAVETIYFGGGTPSRMSDDHLARILGALYNGFNVEAPKEVTLEVNPEDVTPNRIRTWKDLGVNRLSIGIQTFDDQTLETIGRSHTAQQALSVLSAATEAEINFSADLIFGLPGSSHRIWSKDLERLVTFSPQHISVYGLAVEPNTPLSKGVEQGSITVPDEAYQAAAFREANAFLTANGYTHYEVSSYAKAGFEAIHNTNYWHHTPYIGVGPAAHSMTRRGRHVVRTSNVRSLTSWIDLLSQGESPQVESDRLSMTEVMNEVIMLGLRTQRGIDLDALNELGLDLLDEKGAVIDGFVGRNLLSFDYPYLRATVEGWLFLNTITERLLIDDDLA